MTQTSDEEAPALQRDVQRLFGRCLLRLQQYEFLIKAMIADHQMAGPVQDLEAMRAARMDRTARKTLGTLVGEFTGSFLVSSDSDGDPALAEDDAVDVVRVRMGMWMPEADLARTESELAELVTLRNTLVHHFIEQHDLWSVDGCKRAQESLISDYDRIDRSFGRLLEWAKDMQRLRQDMAEILQSEAFQEWLEQHMSPQPRQ